MATRTNINAFELALKKYGDETVPDLVRDRMTAVALEATKGVVELTPVDTGRLKGNWQISLGQFTRSELERVDSSPEGSSAASPAFADVVAQMPAWRQGLVWIHNGLPYANVIETGGPNRFAHHMVRRTADRLRRWLAQ